jgi:hypothetical protein
MGTDEEYLIRVHLRGGPVATGDRVSRSTISGERYGSPSWDINVISARLLRIAPRPRW